jgi:hypothetical protein
MPETLPWLLIDTLAPVAAIVLGGCAAVAYAAPVQAVLVPGGIPSHVAPETPGSIHEAASSAIRSRTPSAPPSTIPI